MNAPPTDSGRPTSLAIWLVNAIVVGVLCWTVFVSVLVCLLGDRWWVGTLAIFSPRWLLALPALGGVICWAWLCNALRWAVLAALLPVWWTFGFCLPLQGWFANPSRTYRVLTCNVADWAGDPKRLDRLIVDSNADIVLLQECRRRRSSLPASWWTHHDGELLVASRFPLRDCARVTRKLPGRWPRTVGLSVTVVTPDGPLQLATVHLLSPRYGLSHITDRRTGIAPSRRALLIEETSQRGSESLHVAEAINKRGGPMVVGGDFNMPVESYFFRKHWRGFEDAFAAVGFGLGNTCFVRQGGLRFGARVDHVLTRGNWHALRCWVGPDVGSDHRPLLADVYRECAGDAR